MDKNTESKNTEGYYDVDIDYAIKLIEEGIEIIDVRTEEEFQLGHIPHAKLYPLQEIYSWFKELNPENKYLLVCRSARRTAVAGEFLASKGFKNIYNMLGGMLEWDGEIEI